MVNKINHGKLFEDRLEEGLIMLSLPYTREGSKRNYGVRGSNKGKFDFWVNNKIAIECKSVETSTNLRLPWPRVKTPKIAAHQLKALRAESEKGNIAGLLIEIRKINKLYWLDIRGLDDIVREFGMLPSLTVMALQKYGAETEDLNELLEVLNKWS